MHSSEPASQTLPRSEFADAVEEAMKRAQRAAARENARYGLPLILEKSRKPARRKITRKAASRRSAAPAPSR